MTETGKNEMEGLLTLQFVTSNRTNQDVRSYPKDEFQFYDQLKNNINDGTAATVHFSERVGTEREPQPCCQGRYRIAKIKENGQLLKLRHTTTRAAPILYHSLSLGTRCPRDTLVQSLAPTGPDHHKKVLI